MSALSDEALSAHIRVLVPKIDLETTGVKTFMQLLSQELGGVDVKPRKAYIKEQLTVAINELAEANDNDSDSSSSDDDDEDVVAPKPPTKCGSGGGLAAPKEISKDLANFFGLSQQSQDATMARKDIVKKLWEYIREHDLQNPANRQEIILDKRLKAVFGCDKFTMFTMNKYIGAHVHPFKPVDLTTSTTVKKRKAAASSKSAGKKRAKSGSSNMPPYQLSKSLALVVGTDILPRPQVVSKIWDYIRSNNLQNPNDKREIICDDKLQAVMKQKKVTMFSMNKLLSPHFLEKVDRERYVPAVAVTQEDDDDDNDSDEEEV